MSKKASKLISQSVTSTTLQRGGAVKNVNIFVIKLKIPLRPEECSQFSLTAVDGSVCNSMSACHPQSTSVTHYFHWGKIQFRNIHNMWT